MRNIGTKSRASDPDRHHVSHPGLGRITLSVPISPDPLNGTSPTQDRRQQIAGHQLFDLPLAICGADPGAFQKTMKITPIGRREGAHISAYISMFMMPPVEEEEVSRLRRRGFSQQRGSRDGTHPNTHPQEMAARALEPGRWILQHRHTYCPFHFSIFDGDLQPEWWDTNTEEMCNEAVNHTNILL